MYTFYLDSEEIRHLLQNASNIKRDDKCIKCNGTGWHNWDENGEDDKPGKNWSSKRDCGECEKCKGIGF